MDNRLAYGNIHLRALEPDDIDLLFEWENDTSLWELSNVKQPYSKQVLAQYMKDATKDIYEQKQVRLIVENLEGKAVGAVDLFEFDPYHQRACVGILIHQSGDQRKGYAHDALCAMEDYCINTLGIRQLYANISEENTASIHLFEKLGYTVSGIKKQWLRTPRGWANEWLMQKFLV